MSNSDRVDLSSPCQHVLPTTLRKVHRPQPGCVDCLRIGGQWVHLRMCLTCGHVGCCDSSPNKHATKHFHQTQHPVMSSAEPGETWAWCFADNQDLSS